MDEGSQPRHTQSNTPAVGQNEVVHTIALSSGEMMVSSINGLPLLNVHCRLKPSIFDQILYIFQSEYVRLYAER